jgi:Flp pilus assembly protein TadD
MAAPSDPEAVAPEAIAEERFLAGLAEQGTTRPDVLRRLALARIRIGDGAGAVAAATGAVGMAPSWADCHAVLGLAHLAAGQPAEARAAAEAALKFDSGLARGWICLGRALAHDPGRMAPAIQALEQGLRLGSRDPQACFTLAALLFQSGRHDAAAAVSRLALGGLGPPDVGEALNNLGLALDRSGRREDALAVLRTARLLRPDLAAISENLGNAHLGNGDPAAAEACQRQALALSGGRATAERWSNLGNALKLLGRLTEGEAAYRNALAMAPNAPLFHANLALCLLLQGRFEEGWREYAWRWAGHPNLPRPIREHRWDGSPLGPDRPQGGTLLVHAEQGLGDTIWMARYLPWLKERRGVTRVVLACQAELVRLLTDVPGVDLVVDAAQPLPPCDGAMMVMSLAPLFGAGLAPLPDRFPYLAVPAGGVPLLDMGGGGFRVGICWAGRPGHNEDRYRSVPAAALEPLWSVPGVSFYSLQKGPVADFVGRPAAGHLLDAVQGCVDFADTARLVASLDLVITVDTAVAHLAGALGRPVWLMVPPVPDFRWGMVGDSSPWYPSLRLYRRSAGTAWEGVVSRIAGDLARKMATNSES